jgi:chemotaxis protein methyltransferase CheR
VEVTAAGLAYRRPRGGRAAAEPAPDLALPAPDPVATERETEVIEPAAGAGTSHDAVEPAAEVEGPAHGAMPEPAPGPARLDAALAAYRAQDYERAAALAEELAREAGTEMAWVIRVRAQANQGRLVEAGHAAAAALERHRGSAELAYLHAVLLLQAGRAEAAVAAGRRALYLDRKLVVAHLLLAQAQARLGDAAAGMRSLVNAERLLAAYDPAAQVPASDGETAARLTQVVRVQLRLLREAA